MANRLVSQLTSRIPLLSDYLPFQKDDGSNEANITSINSILNLVTGSINTSTTTPVLAITGSTLYSLIPSAYPTYLSGSNTGSNIALGENAFSGAAAFGSYYGTDDPPRYPFRSIAIGQNSCINGSISIYGGREGFLSSVSLGRYANSFTLSSFLTNAFGRKTAQNSKNPSSANFFGLGAGYNSTGSDSQGIWVSSVYGLGAMSHYAEIGGGARMGTAAGMRDQASWLSSNLGAGTGYYSANGIHAYLIGNRSGYVSSAGYQDTYASGWQRVYLGTNVGMNTYGGFANVYIGFNVGRKSTPFGTGQCKIGIGKNISVSDVSPLNLGGVIFGKGLWNWITYPNINLSESTATINPHLASFIPSITIGTNPPYHTYTLDVSGSVQATGDVTFSNLLNFANDAEAAAYGLAVGYLYRNGNVLSIRVN